MSEDPLGFDAGDRNLRRYVGNRATITTDPSGLVDPKLPRSATGVGYWKDGPGLFSEVITDDAVRVNGGNGWYHIWDSHKVVEYTDNVPDFIPHLTKTGGQPWIVQVPARGLNGLDRNAAEAAAAEMARSKFGIRFAGSDALAATWHHVDFDRTTQTFTMALVDEHVHDIAKHAGGFADYLDWAAEVLQDADKIRELSDDSILALHRTLQDKKQGQRLLNRVMEGRFLTPRGVKIVKSKGDDIARTVLKLGGDDVIEVIAPKNGGRWAARVVRNGVPVVGTLFVVGNAGSAFAESGDVRDAGISMARDITQADAVEFVHRVTAVKLSEELAEALRLDPTGDHQRLIRRFLDSNVDPKGIVDE